MRLSAPGLDLPWRGDSLAPGSLDLLNNLRDIHEPLAPGLWPLAPGWWLLLALCGLAAAWLAYRAWQRRRRQRPIRRALAELERWQRQASADPRPEAAHELSALLKRAALIHYPRQAVAGLTGTAWLAFLDDSGGSLDFSAGPGQILGHARYAPRVDFDPASLAPLVRSWLERHLDGPDPDALERLQPHWREAA